MIDISKVRIDGGTQSRAAINEQTVADYAEAMADPDTVFPPIIVYFDGRDHWLADGFHRLEAWRRIGRVEVPAEVRQGDRRRAILHSVAANSTHGLRRTNDDKRRAVLTLLEDDEWSQWSNREIARRCAVSEALVRDVRAGICEKNADSGVRTVERGGTTYTVDTTNIGKAEKAEPAPAAQPEPDRSQTGAAPEPDEDHDPVHAEKLDAAPDPHAAVRKALRAMPREILEDEVIGLREEVAELRAKAKALRDERDDFKAKWKEATQEDMGRALGNAQRERDAIKGRIAEHMQTIKRMEYRLKKTEQERDDLRARLENQVVPL